MSMINLSGHGAEIRNEIGTVPAASAAGTVNGTGIDRRGAKFCVLEAMTGAATGAPTTQSLNAKLQHADTLGGSYTDYQPNGVAAAGAITAITAVNSRAKKTIDLTGAKAFIRTVTTTAFTGGASPTLANSVSMILGGLDVIPTQADT